MKEMVKLIYESDSEKAFVSKEILDLMSKAMELMRSALNLSGSAGIIKHDDYLAPIITDTWEVFERGLSKVSSDLDLDAEINKLSGKITSSNLPNGIYLVSYLPTSDVEESLGTSVDSAVEVNALYQGILTGINKGIIANRQMLLASMSMIQRNIDLAGDEDK